MAVMSHMFPSDFLWGAATAGYQVEGDICNNDWDFFTSDAVIHARVAALGKLASPPEHFRLRPAGPAVHHANLHVLKDDLDGYLLKAGQLEYDCRYSKMHGMPVTGGRGFRSLKPLWYNGVPPYVGTHCVQTWRLRPVVDALQALRGVQFTVAVT